MRKIFYHIIGFFSIFYTLLFSYFVPDYLLGILDAIKLTYFYTSHIGLLGLNLLGFLSLFFIGVLSFLYSFKKLESNKIIDKLLIVVIILTLMDLIVGLYSLFCRTEFCPLAYIYAIYYIKPIFLLILVTLVIITKNTFLKITSIIIVLLLMVTSLILYLSLSPKIPSDCDNVREVYERENCYLNFAIKNQDVSLCYLMGDLRNFCLETFANLISDHTICEDINGTYSGFDRDYCFQTVAIKKKDSSICGNIESSVQKGECYTILARLLLDQTICENINGTYPQFPEYGSPKDNCFMRIALEKKDSSICGNIESSVQRDNCYESLAHT